MREMMSQICVSWLAVLHRTALVFLEAMNDEIPVSGISWPPLHYMMQRCQPAGQPSCSAGVKPGGLAQKTQQTRALKHRTH